MKETYIDHYIGARKVREIEDIEEKDGFVVVTFDDGQKEELTKKMAIACLTPDPKDPSELREHYTKFIVQDILTILLAYDIKNIDFDYIQQVTKFSFEGWQEMAIAAKFGKDFKFVSMSQIQKALDEGKAAGIKLYV